MRAYILTDDERVESSVTNNHDGSFSVSFSTSNSGLYSLSVLVNGEPAGLPSERRVVEVLPSEWHAPRCTFGALKALDKVRMA